LNIPKSLPRPRGVEIVDSHPDYLVSSQFFREFREIELQRVGGGAAILVFLEVAFNFDALLLGAVAGRFHIFTVLGVFQLEGAVGLVFVRTLHH